ncbi:hypothetical protein WICMUC_001830 [Wickerhamomyces mucosus]|uniref:Uncharacterized protein n=1 Tax=Wickerhamomyces mucosus TaxID=1378264 RepID=A0A9P8TFV2_9ASCO|nr:hypothetical protein WICMUC_001830 [Wickerhamomyces mucosus]
MSQIWNLFHRTNKDTLLSNFVSSQEVEQEEEEEEGEEEGEGDQPMEGLFEDKEGGVSKAASTSNDVLVDTAYTYKSNRYSNVNNDDNLEIYKKSNNLQISNPINQKRRTNLNKNNDTYDHKSSFSPYPSNSMQNEYLTRNSKIARIGNTNESDDNLQTQKSHEKNTSKKALSPVSTSCTSRSSNLNSSNSLSSSLIFERCVQDQQSLPIQNISRRNSLVLPINPINSSPTNHKYSFSNSQSLPKTKLKKSLSFSSNSTSQNRRPSFPNHLSSEIFVPCVLDASTEVLFQPNPNLSKIEIIKSVNNSFQSYIEPSLRSPKVNSKSPTLSPVSRRISNVSPISNTVCTPKQNGVIDYKDKNQLNFCSFADLLTDELEQQQQQQQQQSAKSDLGSEDDGTSIETSFIDPSPILRKNSSILIIPALNLTQSLNVNVS